MIQRLIVPIGVQTPRRFTHLPEYLSFRRRTAFRIQAGMAAAPQLGLSPEFPLHSVDQRVLILSAAPQI